MVAIIKKVAILALKNKKLRKVLLIALLFIILFNFGALISVGMLPMIVIAKAIEGIFAVFTGLFGNPNNMTPTQWAESVTAGELIECFDSGYTLSGGDEHGLRITTEDFVYLLHKVDDYNNSENLNRQITVEGLHEWYEDTDGDGESEYCSENVERVYTVNNSGYEGVCEMDWRLLYYYCVIASCDRTTSNKTLGNTEDTRSAAEGYFINSDDIDRVFKYTAINYEYTFDVLRDELHKTSALDTLNAKTYAEHFDLPDVSGADLLYDNLSQKKYISYDDPAQLSVGPVGYYSYTDGQSLPHYMDVSGSVHSGSGKYTFYVPQSLLATGKGSFCHIENKLSMGKLNGALFKFDYDTFESTCKSLYKYWGISLMSSVLTKCPGGLNVINKLLSWKASSEADTNFNLAETTIEGVTLGSYSGTSNLISGGLSGTYSTIGEAAASKLCQWVQEGIDSGYVEVSHYTPAGTYLAKDRDWNKWFYTQNTTDRVGEGADCSSFIARAYKAVGLDISESASTYTYYSNMRAYGQEISIDDIKPGDCVLTYNSEDRGNHIAMYVGNGQMASEHGVHKNASIYSAQNDLSAANLAVAGVYLIRPYVGLASSFVPTAGGSTQATSYLGMSESEVAELALNWSVGDSQKTGIIPSIGAGQLLLESSYLQSDLSQMANNCHGMKCPSNMTPQSWSTWDGVSYVELATNEQDANGAVSTVIAKFKKYDSIETAVADHGALLSNADRYKACVGVTDYTQAITIVKNGGYATDTKYIQKVCNVITKWNLNRYDSTYMDMKIEPSEVLSDGTGVSLDASWEYASLSKINSGRATFYKAGSNSNGLTVCVNAGHGTTGGDSVNTPSHPDGSPKVTGGTTQAGAVNSTAVSSGMTFVDNVSEASINLKVAKKLKDKLLAAGYNVVMIRDGDDVQLDNIARTVIANNTSDCHIAIHYDSTDSDKGAFYMAVPEDASYRAMEPVASHWQEHNSLGASLITGLRGMGVKIYSGGSMEMDLTQTSYSTIPSMDIEVGDRASSHTDTDIETVASGLMAGINNYFGK